MPGNPFDNIPTLSAIYDEDEGVQQLVDSGQLTTASNINRPEPTAEVQKINLFNNFMYRNPKAGGGMLVKPSADGSRPGYSKEKKLRKNSPITEKERAKNIKAWEKNTGLDFNEHKKNVSRSTSSLIELGKTTGIAGGGTRETRFEEKQKKIKKFLKGKKTIKASVLKDFILNDVGYKKYDGGKVKSLFPNLVIEQDLQKAADRGLKMSKGKLTVANKYAALMHKNNPKDTQYVSSSNYKELPKNEKGKILAIMRANDNKFRVNYSEQLRFPANKEKLIMRDFGLTEEDFFKHGKFGVPTKIDGKVNKKYYRIQRYVDRGFKLPKVGRYSVTDVLTPDQIEFVKNNFELPEGQKEWNFRSPDNPEGYKHGISPSEYRNLEKQIYTKLKGGSTKYTLAADRNSAKGWMMAAMERVYKNETVLLKNGKRILKEGVDKLTYEPRFNEKGIIIGFTDNTAAGKGNTYYGLNKNTPENATPWTAHGDYDNINKFLNIANGVKEKPDEVLQKILDEKGITKLLGEKRVLTLNDVLSHERFFDKLSTTRPKVLIERQIVLHHTKGVGDKNLARAAATKDIQLLTGAVNSNVIKLENIVKGAPNRPGRKLTQSEIAQLKNYGAKIMDFDGKIVGGGYLDPERQYANIEKQALKYAKGDQFNVKTVASYLERLGCGNAAGGRVFYNEGAMGLTKCAKKGQLKLSNIIAKGTGNKTEQLLATQILNAGRGLKNMASIRGLLGPQAMIFFAATEAGLIGADMLMSGKTLKEAVGDSLINPALGPKLKQDSKKLFVERLKNLGVSDQEIGKGLMLDRMIEDVNTLDDLKQRKFIADQKVEQSKELYPAAVDKEEREIPGVGGFKFDKPFLSISDVRDKRKKEASDIAMDIQDIYRTGDRNVLDVFEGKFQKPETQQIFDQAATQRRSLEGLAAADQARAVAKNIYGKFIQGPRSREKMNELMSRFFDIGLEDANPALFSPIQRAGGFTSGFADGGLSGGDKSGRPPESGPMSQGLPGILKRAMKLKE